LLPVPRGIGRIGKVLVDLNPLCVSHFSPHS
jgi:hypothetical protein